MLQNNERSKQNKQDKQRNAYMTGTRQAKVTPNEALGYLEVHPVLPLPYSHCRYSRVSHRAIQRGMVLSESEPGVWSCGKNLSVAKNRHVIGDEPSPANQRCVIADHFPVREICRRKSPSPRSILEYGVRMLE